MKKLFLLFLVQCTALVYAMEQGTTTQELQEIVVQSDVKSDTPITVFASRFLQSSYLPMSDNHLLNEAFGWENFNSGSLYKTTLNTPPTKQEHRNPRVVFYAMGQKAVMEPFFDTLKEHRQDYWGKHGTGVIVLVAAPLEREKMRMAQELKDLLYGFEQAKVMWVYSRESLIELHSMQTILNEACKDMPAVQMLTCDLTQREDAGEQFEQCLQQELQKLFKSIEWPYHAMIAESPKNHVLAQAGCTRASYIYVVAMILVAGGVVLMALPMDEAFAMVKYTFGGLLLCGGVLFLGLGIHTTHQAYTHY